MDYSAAKAYHAQRAAKRLQARERLRLGKLAAIRTAIKQIVPAYPMIQAVYLFGSVMQNGRFTTKSDIDIAIQCNPQNACLPIETELWRKLEEAVQWEVDLRPYTPPLTQAVANYGECVYARKNYHSGK